MKNSFSRILWVLFPVLLHTVLVAGAQVLLQELVPASGAAAGIVLGNLICILPLGILYGQSVSKREQKEQESRQKGQAFVWTASLLLGLLCSFLYEFMTQRTGIFDQMSGGVQEELGASPLLLQVFGLCLIVPVAEELAYRALSYSRLKRFLNARAAALGIALIFAIGHGNPAQMLYAFPMALLFCACYEKGGLPACILCHAGSNLATVLWNLWCTI